MTNWFQRDKPAEAPESEAPAPKVQVPLFIARRKREGFREYGDRLEPETLRMGETTFARKRAPGQRHGALRAPEEA